MPMDRIRLDDRPKELWLFFGLSGRIGRLPFFLAGMLIQIIVTFLFYRTGIAEPESQTQQSWALAFLFLGIAASYSMIALAAKRAHDMGKTGFLALLMIVPFVTLFAFAAFCLIPGEPAPNRYGDWPNAPGRTG